MMRHGCLAALAFGAALVAAGCTGGMGSLNPATFSRFDGQEPPLTLCLAEYSGPEARDLAAQACERLIAQGLKDTFVIADEDEAYLCYGLYRDREDPAYREGRRTIARAYGSLLGVPLPETAPPTRYDLLEAKGRYTVQVATFDLYGRKHMASDYVGELRRQGWPAFVYHGNTQSNVTIGAFDREIFDDWTRMNNLYKPARIVSAEVQRILKTFPYQNWDGHVFTAAEVANMKATHKEAKVFDPRTGRTEVIVTDFGELFKSKVVAIPAKPRQPAAPLPQGSRGGRSPSRPPAVAPPRPAPSPRPTG